MSEPTNRFTPPLPDLVETIKEARRHASAFRGAPKRTKQLQQLYNLLDHLHFLVAADPDGRRPLPDGRSPMSLSELILTKLASPDFSMQKVRDRIAAGRPKMDDAERTAHEQRHYAVVATHYDYWTDPKWLADMGMDAATIDMLKTVNDPKDRTKLLVELIRRDADLLDQEPWKRPDGLERLHELKWYEAVALNEKLSQSLGQMSIPSTVRKRVPPASAKLKSEERITARRPGRIKRATAPLERLYKALFENVALISEQAFTYYGAKAEFDRLPGMAQSKEGVITLTACIVAARKVSRGLAVYDQDPELFRAVHRHLRDCVSTGKFK